MRSGDDWLLRPVIAGLCRYESLIDGTLDLADVALLCDALNVKETNDLRIEKAQENARSKHP